MIGRFLAAALLLLGLLGAAPSIAAPQFNPCTQAGQSSSECDSVNSGNPLPVNVGTQAPGQFPLNSTAITGAATGTTGAVTATLTSAANNTTYICGFAVSAIGGTATIGPITISNTLTANMVYQAASSASGTTLTQNFSPCIPATAANTNITIATTADGTATAVDVNAWGFNTTASSVYNFTSITGNATGSTGAVVGTLTSAVSKTAYICGFSVSAIGGTATVAPITIAGTITGSLVYQLASTATGNNLTQQFSPCIPASATNTNITVTTTADGTATAVDVNSWGFRQ